MKKVGIVMGSDSDLPIVQKCVDELKKYGVEYEAHIYSAHRTPVQACGFAADARKNGFGVIIGVAGKAAALAGVLAGHTNLPVIGLPVKSSTMDGLDSLLSTVQMPPGVPIACVAIDGAVNAALLAVQILAVDDDELAAKFDADRKAKADIILEKDSKLNI